MWRMIGNSITAVLMLLGIIFLIVGAGTSGELNIYTYFWIGLLGIGVISCFSDFIYFTKIEREKL